MKKNILSYVRVSKHLGAGEACWAHNPKVVGSKPTDAMKGLFPFPLNPGGNYGAVAQMVERLLSMQEVGGSIPSSSKKIMFYSFFEE